MEKRNFDNTVSQLKYIKKKKRNKHQTWETANKL